MPVGRGVTATTAVAAIAHAWQHRRLPARHRAEDHEGHAPSRRGARPATSVAGADRRARARTRRSPPRRRAGARARTRGSARARRRAGHAVSPRRKPATSARSVGASTISAAQHDTAAGSLGDPAERRTRRRRVDELERVEAGDCVAPAVTGVVALERAEPAPERDAVTRGEHGEPASGLTVGAPRARCGARARPVARAPYGSEPASTREEQMGRPPRTRRDRRPPSPATTASARALAAVTMPPVDRPSSARCSSVHAARTRTTTRSALRRLGDRARRDRRHRDRRPRPGAVVADPGPHASPTRIPAATASGAADEDEPEHVTR